MSTLHIHQLHLIRIPPSLHLGLTCPWVQVIEQVTEEDFSSEIALVPSTQDLYHDCTFPQVLRSQLRSSCLVASPACCVAPLAWKHNNPRPPR